MEKLHSLIDDLELMADKLPKEANWFGNVDHIRQTIKDMRRALQQAPCSTLREELHTIANRLLYSYPSLMEEVACKEVDKKIEAINLVMELIDAQQPVA